MNAPENIVKMPDRLERRALKIEAAMDRRDLSNKDWREATLELAVELAGARRDHSSDQAFGDWLEQRFGARAPAKTNRAILIRWGNAPDKTLALLEAADNRSIQIIDRRFPSKNNSPPKRGRPRHNKIEATAEAIKERTGEWPSPTELAHEAGVNRRNADNALRTAKAAEEARTDAEAKADAAEAALVASVKYTKAQQEHIDGAIRRRTRELEKAFATRKAELERIFWAEVGKRCDENEAKRFPLLQKRENEAYTAKEHYLTMIRTKAFFTKDQAKTILMCLHPDGSDSRTKEKLNEAFLLFNAKLALLTGEI